MNFRGDVRSYDDRGSVITKKEWGVSGWHTAISIWETEREGCLETLGKEGHFTRGKLKKTKGFEDEG